MSVRLFSTAALIGLGLATTASVGAQAPRVQKIDVSVIDKAGAPVTDLTNADFVVKVGGAERPIMSFRQANAPFRIAVIDADGGTGAFQNGIAHFVARLLQNADPATKVSFISVVEQPEVVADYTDDVDKIGAALKLLGKRAAGKRPAGQLMEAVSGAVKTVKAEGVRPVILVVRLGGEAASSDRAEVVRENLRKSGAQLFVVAPPGADNGSGGSGGVAGGGGGNMGEAQTQFAASSLADRGVNMGLVLQDGSKDSGGRPITAGQNVLDKAMEALADELLAQYEIGYALPDAGTPADTISVSTTRKDVKLTAPSRVPN